MARKFRIAQFISADEVEVKGPFTPAEGDPPGPALVSFYISQTTDEVDEEGNPKWITVGGNGNWSGVEGDEWTGKCAGDRLTVGKKAWGYGMAILVQEDPPGFSTWTWQSPVPVTGTSTA